MPDTIQVANFRLHVNGVLGSRLVQVGVSDPREEMSLDVIRQAFTQALAQEPILIVPLVGAVLRECGEGRVDFGAYRKPGEFGRAGDVSGKVAVEVILRWLKAATKDIQWQIRKGEQP